MKFEARFKLPCLSVSVATADITAKSAHYARKKIEKNWPDATEITIRKQAAEGE